MSFTTIAKNFNNFFVEIFLMKSCFDEVSNVVLLLMSQQNASVWENQFKLNFFLNENALVTGQTDRVIFLVYMSSPYYFYFSNKLELSYTSLVYL